MVANIKELKRKLHSFREQSRLRDRFSIPLQRQRTKHNATQLLIRVRRTDRRRNRTSGQSDKRKHVTNHGFLFRTRLCTSSLSRRRVAAWCNRYDFQSRRIGVLHNPIRVCRQKINLHKIPAELSSASFVRSECRH